MERNWISLKSLRKRSQEPTREISSLSLLFSSSLLTSAPKMVTTRGTSKAGHSHAGASSNDASWVEKPSKVNKRGSSGSKQRVEELEEEEEGKRYELFYHLIYSLCRRRAEEEIEESRKKKKKQRKSKKHSKSSRSLKFADLPIDVLEESESPCKSNSLFRL